MASVTLDQLWLQDAANPSTAVKVYLASKTENTDIPGDVREYAGGRLRSVVRAGKARRWVADLDLINTSDYDTVLALQDSLVLWRDHLGGKLYGRYFQLDARRVRGPSGFVRRVRVRFDEVTHSEEV